jgi:hypothetical protein
MKCHRCSSFTTEWQFKDCSYCFIREFENFCLDCVQYIDENGQFPQYVEGKCGTASNGEQETDVPIPVPDSMDPTMEEPQAVPVNNAAQNHRELHPDYAERISQEEADALPIFVAGGYKLVMRYGRGYTLYHYQATRGISLADFIPPPPRRFVWTGAPRPRRFSTKAAPIISQEVADRLPKYKEGGYFLKTYPTPGHTLYYYQKSRICSADRERQLGIVELLGPIDDVPRPRYKARVLNVTM